MVPPVYCLVSQGKLSVVPLEHKSDQLDGISPQSFPSQTLYLPQSVLELSQKPQLEAGLKDVLIQTFSHWKKENISIKRVTGGITNMLLSCRHKNKDTVLVRAYGQGTDTIIDRDREFASLLLLHSLGLAAPIYCRFQNGVIYGFVAGRSINTEEMSHPFLYPLIAQRLGQWHRSVIPADIEKGVQRLRSLQNDKTKVLEDVWQLLREWIEIVPLKESLLECCLRYICISAVDHSSDSAPISLRDILIAELGWAQSEIGSRSPIVASHCDLLSGNIIIPESISDSLDKTLPGELPHIDNNPISFIDFEYMMPAPRAFDIANHFVEWQGFECDKSLVPDPSKDNKIMRKWCRSYLSNFGEGEVVEEDVDGLIEEVALFYGMPGFYWGIWAAIQSDISLIDFDYTSYCLLRLEEYWSWKRNYIESA